MELLIGIIVHFKIALLLSCIIIDDRIIIHSLVVYEPRMFFHLIRFSLLSAVICKLQCTSFTHLYFSAQDIKTKPWAGPHRTPEFSFLTAPEARKPQGKGRQGPLCPQAPCLSAWGESKGARALTLCFFLTMLPAVSFSPAQRLNLHPQQCVLTSGPPGQPQEHSSFRTWMLSSQDSTP